MHAQVRKFVHVKVSVWPFRLESLLGRSRRYTQPFTLSKIIVCHVSVSSWHGLTAAHVE